MRGKVIARVAICSATVAALLAVPAATVEAAQAAVGPSLVRYPYLSDLTDTSVAVTWATTSADSSPGVVTYGTNGNCTQSTAANSAVSSYSAFGETARYYLHTVQLSGLSASTTYCYRIYSGTSSPGTPLLGEPPDFPTTFTTRPAAGSSQSFSFDVLGDWGETALNNSGPAKDLYNPYQAALDSHLAASASGADPARFAISAGDIAYNNGSTTNYGDLNHPADGIGGSPQWSDVFDARYWGKVGSALPLYPATGNHGRNSTFFSTWPMTTNVRGSSGIYGMSPYPAVDGLAAGNYPSDWFAFTAGNVRFYVLDVDWNDLSAANYPTLGLGCTPKACPMYQAERDLHWQQSSAEYRWLNSDLQADTAQRGASALRMVFFHYPIRVDQNNSTTQSDVYLQNSAANPSGAASSLEALLARYRVNLVFNAHAHMYQRSIAPLGGVPTYVTGGGGGVPTNVSPVCSSTDAYARGWAPTSGKGSSCGSPSNGGAAKPTAAGEIYHFLRVRVSGTDVTVQPTNSTGAVFDPMTYHFVADTTAPSVPGAPTASRAPGPADVTVHLGSSSSDNVGVVAYDVYCDGAYRFSVPAGVAAWTDTGVPGGTHTWTVRARDQRGNQSSDSLASNPVTIPDTVPPSAPGRPSATVSPHKVALTWVPATDDVGVTGYNVYRNGTPLATGVTGASYTDITAADLTTYSYTVRAVDAGNNVSPPSPARTVTTGDWTAPTAPHVTASGAGAGKITVQWPGANDNVKVTGYDVYRDGKVAVGNVSGTRWTDTQVPGSRHRYRVVAFDAAGNRSASSNVVTVTAPLVKPVVHINRTSATVARNAKFTVYGAVTPAVAHTVQLQESRGTSGNWVTVQRMTTSMRTLPSGNHAVGYAFTLSRSTKGSYSYRVVWPAGGGYAGLTTKAVRVTVR
ncbi:MAG TPA: fibronectin type III domain-containing protein [Jatrophihabitans sp.]|jgi:hypothetical protein